MLVFQQRRKIKCGKHNPVDADSSLNFQGEKR